MVKKRIKTVERKIGPSDDPALLISIPEAKQVLPLGEATYWRRIADGELRPYRAGGRTFLKLGDVLNLAKPAK